MPLGTIARPSPSAQASRANPSQIIHARTHANVTPKPAPHERRRLRFPRQAAVRADERGRSRARYRRDRDRREPEPREPRELAARQDQEARRADPREDPTNPIAPSFAETSQSSFAAAVIFRGHGAHEQTGDPEQSWDAVEPPGARCEAFVDRDHRRDHEKGEQRSGRVVRATPRLFCRTRRTPPCRCGRSAATRPRRIVEMPAGVIPTPARREGTPLYPLTVDAACDTNQRPSTLALVGPAENPI